MKIYIDGTEVLCGKNINIKEEMLATSSVVLNNVFPKSWDDEKDYVNQFYFPKDYSKCLIKDENDNLLFAGVVKNTGNISLNPREPHYADIQVLDFKTFLSEGTILDFVINNKTILEAISLVISKVADYGFIVGEIKILNENDVIGTYNTQNMTAYDVLQYLSEISESRWFTRMIDENTIAIDFYDPTLMPQGLEIEYTKEFFEDNQIIDMKYSYSSNDYRNKQVMTSSDTLASIETIDSYYTDGYNSEFVVSQRIGQMISITVDGVSKSFGTNVDKEMGFESDFYYDVGNNIISGATTYTAGKLVVITYVAIIKGRQVIYNVPEVERINSQTNRNGVIARYETRNDVSSSEELQTIGESYIKYKGESEITLTIDTKDTNIWNIGQVVEWNDAPLEELNKTYMCKSKTTKKIVIKNDDFIFYEYVFSSSFNSENAINYFDNQRRKAYGNIEAESFIDRNEDIENAANIIFDNLIIEEMDLGNALNSVLNAPLNL